MRNNLLQRLLLFGCVLMPAFSGVRADTLSNFSFNASFANGATGFGYATIDVTTGTVTSLDLGVTGVGGGTGFTVTGPYGQSVSNGGYFAQDYDSLNGRGVLISFPQSSLVGYVGGYLCSLSMSCSTSYPSTYYADRSGNFSYASSAALLPSGPAPAPEIDPSLGYGAMMMLAGGIAVLRGQRRTSPA